jgi:hypothetical protein
MPEPNLIHPIPVIIEQRDIAATVYDEDTREPVRQVARKVETTINAQVLWDFHDDPRHMASGLDLEETGYILAKISELVSASISLSFGDRIIKIGDLDVELYITRTRPLGHYPPMGATILRAYFADRDPTHGSGIPTGTP